MSDRGEQADAFERCITTGGVAVFAADTVYGLACDAADGDAIGRLYALKRRPLDKPSAVMFFDLEAALRALPELGPRTAAALAQLLPGPVSLLVANPARRFAAACGEHPDDARAPGSGAARARRRVGGGAAVQREPCGPTRGTHAGRGALRHCAPVRSSCSTAVSCPAPPRP